MKHYMNIMLPSAEAPQILSQSGEVSYLQVDNKKYHTLQYQLQLT
jgi:hypothetical protein